MSERCSWCNTDPDEAAARFEGPHATWCVHYRTPPHPLERIDWDNPVVNDALRKLGSTGQEEAG